MLKRFSQLLIIATLAFFALPASAARMERAALFRIEPLGLNPELVARLAGLLRMELDRLLEASLLDQAAVERVLQTHPHLASCTGEPGCLSAIGRALNVQQVVSGNIGGMADSYVINIKLVDVSSQKELRRVQESISGPPEQLIQTIRVAVYRLVAPQRLRGSLDVLSNVSGAHVYLDDAPQGETPIRLIDGIPIGEHLLRLTKANYVDSVHHVFVDFQKTTRLIAKLDLPTQDPTRKQVMPTVAPWYSRWWMWTLVGAVAVGTGVALGLGLAHSSAINCDVEHAKCGY